MFSLRPPNLLRRGPFWKRNDVCNSQENRVRTSCAAIVNHPAVLKILLVVNVQCVVFLVRRGPLGNTRGPLRGRRGGPLRETLSEIPLSETPKPPKNLSSLLPPYWFRRRTNVKQLTCKCNIRSSNYFYYLFFSSVLFELKPFVSKGKVLGKNSEKVWKVWKSVKNSETILPFSCCPLVFLWWFLLPLLASPKFFLPALLQKLVGDFFRFFAGKICGNFAGIFSSTK